MEELIARSKEETEEPSIQERSIQVRYFRPRDVIGSRT